MKDKKTYTLHEAENIVIGKRGTWRREAYEQQLKDELEIERQKKELEKNKK